MTKTASRRLLLLAATAAGLSGCLGARPPERFAGEAPVMRPERFFAGVTRSWGVLETRGGAPSRTFRVEGRGRAEPDGSFTLVQTIAMEGEPVRTRTWRLRATGAHAYEGSLTDASGPVRGEAWGDLFHLSYAMRSPAGGRMEQWLYLQDDGRTVLNEATVRVLGVVVARLSERITNETEAEAAARADQSRPAGPVSSGRPA